MIALILIFALALFYLYSSIVFIWLTFRWFPKELSTFVEENPFKIVFWGSLVYAFIFSGILYLIFG